MLKGTCWNYWRTWLVECHQRKCGPTPTSCVRQYTGAIATTSYTEISSLRIC
ncbi:hypothetical protein DPMN_108595 [Dreissena polymorpha]|uniref:Uncharacterized protein n=1 Tax=Dreissena polymorpha TaxID=45954 RepID=A0A9D4QM72_DREPO|nr:hypothetical protein DPMN_108595 [Dreissena polymorpha]